MRFAKYFGVWSVIVVLGKEVLAITSLKISVKFSTIFRVFNIG